MDDNTEKNIEFRVCLASSRIRCVSSHGWKIFLNAWNVSCNIHEQGKWDMDQGVYAYDMQRAGSNY